MLFRYQLIKPIYIILSNKYNELSHLLFAVISVICLVWNAISLLCHMPFRSFFFFFISRIEFSFIHTENVRLGHQKSKYYRALEECWAVLCHL